ncbi:10834_t:CDS:2 [Entrophospora sp. SA101]|nr:10834_t:CDS:2 [Entrophospora sp. SA101]
MTALTLPSIPSLGSSNYWCLTISNPDYIFIEAFDHDEMVDSAERLDRWKRLEKQAIRNTLIYVLNFMKWLPILPFGIYIIMRYDNMWMNVVFIIAFNSGGFFNCILYLMNQAFLRDSKSKSFVSLGNYNNRHFGWPNYANAFISIPMIIRSEIHKSTGNNLFTMKNNFRARINSACMAVGCAVASALSLEPGPDLD